MKTELPDGATETESLSAADNFVETALKLGGKSEEEARTTGKIDRADDQVERMFAERYRTTNSPVHRAVWTHEVPVELFSSRPAAVDDVAHAVMERSLEVARRHKRAGTLFDHDGRVTDALLGDLATAGYWGLLVDKSYGGSGAPFSAFASFLTRMATIDPTVAGLASVHGCIGAVDPLRAFGNEEQKRRYLPKLASGERLSGFALTEPCAGSDLTALRTNAVRDGDDYVVNGEKLFITNAIPGRTVGLVCLIDKKPAVLIADLPPYENEHFQIVRYGLYALRHSYNNGLRFKDFRVPAANLLSAPQGDGLTIAYHGLNLGRVALCATAAGSMRAMLANMIPWTKFRKTYGQPIETRELVRRRVGRLAGLIVACDALVAWCSDLLDQGYRGEMECIVAKIFGSESQKEAAIELYMKTEGGRAFLHGHPFGDNVHEFLAPCIYEGEGEMLGMGFFKSLIKDHGKAFFEPIGRVLADLGVKQPNPLNPSHAWALRKPLANYAKWFVGETVAGSARPNLPTNMPANLAAHARFATEQMQSSRMEISKAMRTHQLRLADRQCRMSELSARAQSAIVMITTSLYAARQDDEIVRAAADVLCRELNRQLTGRRPSDKDFRAMTELGKKVEEGGFKAIAGIDQAEILMKY
jgi:alkylation response protein AidB-like acyl-CoA dehydrogenase